MVRPVFLAFGLSVLLATIFSVPVSAAGSHILRVGSYHGISGQYQTIQQAVNAAQPGDWILIGPGDYHEQGSSNAGVLVTTPGIHIRGMDRNHVIVDGTLPGSATCSSAPDRQNFGPNGSGRNGVEVLKVDGVSVENLTACNFVSSDAGSNGNQIWFNGGDGSGRIGMGSFRATYLTASSTYYKDNNSAQAQYGIFASNVGGPGRIDQTYSSNMGDSAYYVGACSDCNVVLTHAHAQNSALGYSGTNAGGHLIIEDSEWDQNKAGIVPNSLNNDDWPSPQNGACPSGQTGPTGTSSCMIIRDNYVHDNNNPNVPQFGIAGSAPVGTGIELAGSQNDTVIDNKVINQGLWGILIHDLPDPETPPANNPNPCSGGIQLSSLCYFVGYGNEVTRNFLKHNGFFGNVTNGDLADGHIASNPGNCWHGNHDPNGVTSDPANIQTTMGTCGVANQGDPTVQAEVLCVGFGDPQSCASLPPLHFPQETSPVLMPIPDERTMPNPCAGVPANPWCEDSSLLNQLGQAWTATSTGAALNGAELPTLAAFRKR
jgi:Right handed beta helix region